MSEHNTSQIATYDQSIFNFGAKLPMWMKIHGVPLIDYATALKDWLQCQDFILAMKCASINYPDCNLKSMRHFKLIINSGTLASPVKNAKIAAFWPTPITQIDEFFFVDAKAWAVQMQARIPQVICTLKAAPLKDKREVLRYAQIITVPVAAAFLGITEDMLNGMKHSFDCAFGARYAGGYCYSLDELNMIAQNLQSACEWVYDKIPQHSDVDSTVLDYAILVDEQTATAITDMTLEELNRLLVKTEHTRRPYRLADLEKIRVQKLAQQLN